MDEARDVDVIVVGSGVAGLAAALTARERGARSVLVAESEGVVGGSSRLSGGLIMGAGTRYQKAHGIDDDADSMFHDYLQLNRWNVDAGVVRRFCELAGPTVEWLGDLGVEYYDTLVFGGEERVPRVHVPIGRGQAVDRRPRPALPRGRRRRRARPACRPVAHRRPARSSASPSATTRSPPAPSSSPPAGSATTRRSWPRTSRRRPTPGRRGTSGPTAPAVTPSTSPSQVGAQVDRPRPRPAPAARRLRPDLRGVPAGLDRAGQPRRPALRRRDDLRTASSTRRRASRATWCTPIFDHATLEAATAAGVARYKHSIPGSTKRQSPHWNADIVEQMVTEGRMTSAASIAELAAALGVPSTNLDGTVARYNAGVAAGHRPRLPQGRQVPGAGRHAAVLRRRAASGDRGVDGLRPAHRPRRQRARHRRRRHPRPLRRRRVHRRRRRRPVRRQRQQLRQLRGVRPGRRRLGGGVGGRLMNDTTVREIPLMPVGQAFDMGQRRRRHAADRPARSSTRRSSSATRTRTTASCATTTRCSTTSCTTATGSPATRTSRPATSTRPGSTRSPRAPRAACSATPSSS